MPDTGMCGKSPQFFVFIFAFPMCSSIGTQIGENGILLEGSSTLLVRSGGFNGVSKPRQVTTGVLVLAMPDAGMCETSPPLVIRRGFETPFKPRDRISSVYALRAGF
jgi:hypothetical protein